MTKENIDSKFNLNGKIAVVTGGCGFLGEQHCLALAEIGAKVIALDLATSSKPESFNKLEIFVISCDITDENEVMKVFKGIAEEHKKVDILINNAAIDHKVKSNGLSS
jgi:NAD(P)-dependent dehydrogenase (short-subunit alcohol dehydrogenase family)